MISKFRKFIDKESLFEEDDKILLACSGGIDSMVLADLLLIDKCKFGIAHINHQTREEASDADQNFVETFCKQHSIKFHFISAPVEKIAEASKENFQAYARKFRYKFFLDVLNEYSYDYIATAHHASDTLETFFLNLTRSTGLDGLTGIPLRNNKIIRPLLFASKEDILNYALKFKIDFREDASNANTKYRRNLIRHDLIPKLKSISPEAEQNTKSTIEKLASTNKLLKELIESKSYLNLHNNKLFIEKAEIEEVSQKSTLLFYLIKDYGFNYSQSMQIIRSANKVGAIFHSSDYSLLVDRSQFILNKKQKENKVNLKITKPGTYTISETLTLGIQETNNSEKDVNCEYFDASNLRFPLLIRNWKAGDKFAPLGMGGKMKKIKDYLIDRKINRHDKESILVMISDDKIAWLVGEQISESFKYHADTKRFLKLCLTNSLSNVDIHQSTFDNGS